MSFSDQSIQIVKSIDFNKLEVKMLIVLNDFTLHTVYILSLVHLCILPIHLHTFMFHCFIHILHIIHCDRRDVIYVQNVLHSMLMTMASVIAVQSSENARLLSRAVTTGSQLSNIVYEVLPKYFNFVIICFYGEISCGNYFSSV